MNFNAVQQEMVELLKTVPQGVVVEYSITGNQIEFLIKEKPADFTQQQAEELINQLNAVVLQKLPLCRLLQHRATDATQPIK